MPTVTGYSSLGYLDAVRWQRVLSSRQSYAAERESVNRDYSATTVAVGILRLVASS